MARHARFVLPGVPLHIVHRGNNRQACFHEEADYRVYLRFLETYSAMAGCDVHAYALMTNHTHLLLTPARNESPAELMKALAQNFSHYINRRRGRTGSLWEGRYWSGIVGEPDYLLRTYRYIDRNPVDAGICASPEAYPWTSYGTRPGAIPQFIKHHPVYLGLGENEKERRDCYRKFIATPPTSRESLEIEMAVKGGFAWGSETFLDRLATELGPDAVRRRGSQRNPDD